MLYVTTKTCILPFKAKHFLLFFSERYSYIQLGVLTKIFDEELISGVKSIHIVLLPVNIYYLLNMFVQQ